MLPPRGAFIVGMERSGTSLLTSLIDGHPDVMRLPHETHAMKWHALADPVAGLFEHSHFGDVLLGEERERFERALRERLPGPADVRTALLALIESATVVRPPQGSPSLWIEKTPRHLDHLPLLLAAFGPQTRAVILIRDPRAVMASHKARWQRAGLHAARRCARRWAQVDALARRIAAVSPAVLLLRYEALVTDTEACMRTVASHLGIEFQPVLLQPTRRGQQWSGNSSFGDKAQGISQASMGRWRQELDAEEHGEIERALAPRMQAWGYAPELSERGSLLARGRVEVSVARHLWRCERSWPRESASMPARSDGMIR